jgi:hypothetical protein
VDNDRVVHSTLDPVKVARVQTSHNARGRLTPDGAEERRHRTMPSATKWAKPARPRLRMLRVQASERTDPMANHHRAIEFGGHIGRAPRVLRVVDTCRSIVDALTQT